MSQGTIIVVPPDHPDAAKIFPNIEELARQQKGLEKQGRSMSLLNSGLATETPSIPTLSESPVETVSTSVAPAPEAQQQRSEESDASAAIIACIVFSVIVAMLFIFFRTNK